MSKQVLQQEEPFMNIDAKDLLASILESLDRIDYIKPEDIPGIDLYMDQVTTFMEKQLSRSKRFPDDKILTKTMINNYAKNHLLPPPEKKKYSREHLLLLVFIYYFKGFLSINDIQTLLSPLTEKYFQTEDGLSLQDIYSGVFYLEHSQIELLKQDLTASYDTASKTFTDAPEEDQAFLQLFTFICLLSVDVYLKKQVIEKLVDLLPNPNEKKSTKKNEKKEVE